jgi:hypothetical protein
VKTTAWLRSVETDSVAENSLPSSGPVNQVSANHDKTVMQSIEVCYCELKIRLFLPKVTVLGIHTELWVRKYREKPRLLRLSRGRQQDRQKGKD